MAKKICLFAIICFLFVTASLQADYLVLHSFAGNPSYGVWPQGSLILSGFTLYGMTEMGGDYDLGQIFKINTDGTGFNCLHSFSGWDGETPRGSLILSGSTLYGLASSGGNYRGGTIFKIQTDGTGFKLLHVFLYNQDEGGLPLGSLILSNSTLYGMTFVGGASEYSQGTIFKMYTDGTGYATLHSFMGYPSDGAMPRGSLILIGSSLYGMTSSHGAKGYGTVFKINTDGSGYDQIHQFTGLISDGGFPDGSLTLVGSALYGMTGFGGTYGQGTIFKINPDGTGFGLVHSFADWPSDGSRPTDSVILIGSVLHGMTLWGGAHDFGAVFKVNTDGTGYALSHSFSDGTKDGAHPWGSLTNSGQVLYGMTSTGGATDQGIIFVIMNGQADIVLSESVDNVAPEQGNEFNFTITATNRGPQNATGIKVSDLLTMASGLRFISAYSSQGSYAARAGVWDVGTLAKHTMATLTIKVKALKSGACSNSAAATVLNEYDPIIANNSASMTINVLPALPGIRGVVKKFN
jgi:uncharacterized repeat protein (TIGR01451 family)